MFSSLLLLHDRVPSTAPAGPDEGINQLAFLVGGTWVARPDPKEPDTTVAETCVWGPDNAVIITSVEQKLNGQPVGTAHGVFSYDDETSQLESASVTSTGLSQTSEELDKLSGPSFWTFRSTIDAAGLTAKKLVTMRHTADDVLVVTTGPVTDDVDAPAVGATTLTYNREAGPP